jgi:O-antigen ligase
MIFQGFICIYQSWSQDVSHIFGDLFGKHQLYIEEMEEKMKTFFLVSPGSDFKRASGTVGAINAEAQYFEFILPFAFLLSLTAVDFRHRVFNAIAFLIGLSGLILTFSRGGFIGLTAGILAAVIFSIAFKTGSRRKLVAVIIFGLLTTTVFGSKIYGYMMTRQEAISARFRLYEVGLDLVRAHPVVGVGLNNHNVVIREFDPETHVIDMPVHNNYLVIASEVGLPGLVFFVTFLILNCIAALRAARSNNRYVTSWAIGILAAYIAISVHNLVDHLDSHTNLTLLWLYAGLAVALTRLNESDSKRVTKDENRPH